MRCRVRGVSCAVLCAGRGCDARSAVRNARARHAPVPRAGYGERGMESGMPSAVRPGHSHGGLARSLGPSPGSGVDTVGEFPEGCPGTVSSGGCVYGSRVVLADHRTAPAAPVLNTALRTGEREASGERVK